MILLVFTVLFLALVTTRAAALPYDVGITHIAAREPYATNCTASCATYMTEKMLCASDPRCICTVKFLQSQADCRVCQTDTPIDAAKVQFLLDRELSKCRVDGVKVDLQLQLPPPAAEIVQEVNNLGGQLRQEQIAFLTLQILGGHVGLVIVLGFAIFSAKVKRGPTFFNFCITWIFSSIVFSVLLYRGTEGNTVLNFLGHASSNGCLVQATLTSGAQAMTAGSTAAMVTQLWLTLRTSIHGNIGSPRQTRWTTIALLATPYILFLGFTLPAVLSMGARGQSLERALPTNFYCIWVKLNPFLISVYAVNLGIFIITVVLDLLIINILYRNWRTFRHIETKSAISLSILLRILIFSLYHVVVAIAYGCLIYKTVKGIPRTILTDDTKFARSFGVHFGVPSWVDMLQAATPLLAALVLGLDKETITTLMFWRKEPEIRYIT